MSVLPRLPHALRNSAARLLATLLSCSLISLTTLFCLIATPACAEQIFGTNIKGEKNEDCYLLLRRFTKLICLR
jgi:hypothetical protein